jgi:hypothetical protein
MKCIEATIIQAYEIIDPNLEVWVTSGNDSKHMKNSLHFEDLAMDYRTLIIGHAPMRQVLARLITFMLGDDYDVVLEVDHLHVEYDPK